MRNSSDFKAFEKAVEGHADDALRVADPAGLRSAAKGAAEHVPETFLLNARDVILARREQGRVETVLADVLALVREAYPDAEVDRGADRAVIYWSGLPDAKAARDEGVVRG